MIILDASVLIAHLDEEDAQHGEAEAVLEVLSSHELGASSLTLAEVLVGPAQTGRLAAVRGALTALEIREIRLGGDAAVRLAELRAETGLKLPDCCVLLAAQDRAASVVTFDQRLGRVAAELGLG